MSDDTVIVGVGRTSTIPFRAMGDAVASDAREPLVLPMRLAQISIQQIWERGLRAVPSACWAHPEGAAVAVELI